MKSHHIGTDGEYTFDLPVPHPLDDADYRLTKRPTRHAPPQIGRFALAIAGIFFIGVMSLIVATRWAYPHTPGHIVGTLGGIIRCHTLSQDIHAAQSDPSQQVVYSNTGAYLAILQQSNSMIDAFTVYDRTGSCHGYNPVEVNASRLLWSYDDKMIALESQFQAPIR